MPIKHEIHRNQMKTECNPQKSRKFPSKSIVSLNLAKCVSHNMIDLIIKSEKSKKHHGESTAESYDQEKAQTKKIGDKNQTYASLNATSRGNSTAAVNSDKEISPESIYGMARKKFKHLGHSFIKEFRYFSNFGNLECQGNSISYPRTLMWFKKAKILDNDRVTMRDVEVHFINKLKDGSELKILEFIRFLKSLSEDRGLEMTRILFRLLHCRDQMKPIRKRKPKCSAKNFIQKKKLLSARKKKLQSHSSKKRESLIKAPESNDESFRELSEIKPSNDNSATPCNKIFKKIENGKEIKKDNVLFKNHNIFRESMDDLSRNANRKAFTLGLEPKQDTSKLNEVSSDNNGTVLRRKSTKVQDKCLENNKNRKGIKSIVTKKGNARGDICKKVSANLKKKSNYIKPHLKSIPTLQDEDNEPVGKKSLVSRTKKSPVFKDDSKLSVSRRLKSEAKRTKNKSSKSEKGDKIKSKKKLNSLLSKSLLVTGHMSLARIEEESYEYIDQEETPNSTKHKVEAIKHFESLKNKDNIKAVRAKEMKFNVKTKSGTKQKNSTSDEEMTGVTAIQPCKRKKNSRNTNSPKRNAAVSANQENQILKNKTRTRTKNHLIESNTFKVKSSVEERTSKDISKKKIAENISTKNENMNLNKFYRKPRYTPKLSAITKIAVVRKSKIPMLDSRKELCTKVQRADSNDAHLNKLYRKPRYMPKLFANSKTVNVSQSKIPRLDNRKELCTKIPHTDLNNISHKTLNENKKIDTRNNRTFTNLTIQKVNNNLRKSEKFRRKKITEEIKSLNNVSKSESSKNQKEKALIKGCIAPHNSRKRTGVQNDSEDKASNLDSDSPISENLQNSGTEVTTETDEKHVRTSTKERYTPTNCYRLVKSPITQIGLENKAGRSNQGSLHSIVFTEKEKNLTEKSSKKYRTSMKEHLLISYNENNISSRLGNNMQNNIDKKTYSSSESKMFSEERRKSENKSMKVTKKHLKKNQAGDSTPLQKMEKEIISECEKQRPKKQSNLCFIPYSHL